MNADPAGAGPAGPGPDPGGFGPDEGRRREALAAALEATRLRIDRATRAAGRPLGDVRLVVVTKTFPASDTALLAGLGVTDVGESREPEASAKAEQASGVTAATGLRWHQVGQVQTRKAPAVAGWADAVHSVDRDRLVGALDLAAEREGRVMGCFLQVSLDGDPTRAGASPDLLGALADAVDACGHLDLAGVMAVPPAGVDPRPHLERLAVLSARLRVDHPHAREISAGMSNDLEEAIASGATLVRVGRAVMGDRPPLR